MEFVILDLVDADGLEGSEADVQGDVCGLDAALADAVEDLRGEVKTGGGRGYRSTLQGVDGLVALAIAGGIRTYDVGRERDVADAIECGKKIVRALGCRLEADAAFAEFGTGQDFGLEFIVLAEEEALTDTDLAAGADQAFPIVRFGGKLAGEENLDASMEKSAGCGIVLADWLSAGAFAAAIEAGGEDAGVVENNKIAGPEQVWEIAKQAIRITAGDALDAQHAGVVTGGEGFLGDELVRKVEVEVGNAHGVRL